MARCQVPCCTADLSTCKFYNQRYKICPEHRSAAEIIVAGRPMRFCQQCAKLHDLQEFDGLKKSCREKLQRHNLRRIMRKRVRSDNEPLQTSSAVCQVPGCNRDLSTKVCVDHLNSLEVDFGNGELQRFCQICIKFHPISCFNGRNRNCKKRDVFSKDDLGPKALEASQGGTGASSTWFSGHRWHEGDPLDPSQGAEELRRLHNLYRSMAVSAAVPAMHSNMSEAWPPLPWHRHLRPEPSSPDGNAWQQHALRLREVIPPDRRADAPFPRYGDPSFWDAIHRHAYARELEGRPSSELGVDRDSSRQAKEFSEELLRRRLRAQQELPYFDRDHLERPLWDESLWYPHRPPHAANHPFYGLARQSRLADASLAADRARLEDWMQRSRGRMPLYPEDLPGPGRDLVARADPMRSPRLDLPRRQASGMQAPWREEVPLDSTQVLPPVSADGVGPSLVRDGGFLSRPEPWQVPFLKSRSTTDVQAAAAAAAQDYQEASNMLMSQWLAWFGSDKRSRQASAGGEKKGEPDDKACESDGNQPSSNEVTS
uniref:Squamosa promoter-binding-like protein 8-like n=1 Tax=Tetraselmis sp. GSL018 TaxID=582737 RepID=A0A061RJA4_9CHLO|eukprot:CAMPEP_0177625106 /NCGR_PEP_ID=MMETSP0419_2-20121207/29906_1 /TAXON_ID=582737 /ORGANISM="Tetraselmis sp., Strain GSL018" /LENGTH=541 /DNA_ID=CAMNT_0019125997 /DNA_START=148 /DNA_END=1773 /DNA_ORIENTATION=-